MKIVYIASVRLPTEKAHGVQIMKTCEALAKSGIKTSLFVPNYSSTNDIKEDAFLYYGVRKLFTIKKLFGIRLIRLGALGFFSESLIFFISVIFSSDFWKADYIYSRDEMIVVLSSLLGRKSIWETHTGSYNYFAKIALKKAYLIVAISQGLKDFYVEKGTNSNKVVVAHDSVDLDEFKVSKTKNELREKFGLPQDKKIILYVGRLDGWKGIKVFLDATKYFNDLQVALIIGGDNDQINNLSKDYKNVIFWGYRPYKDLPMYQKLADVLVVPNTGKSEVSKFFTSPLKVFAYMASGVSIVASDLPSIREILNEDNSILVEPDNPKAFADAINMILGDEGRARMIREQALRDVRMYTWDERVKNILSSLK
ncbi:MAG: glycosyltransferase family 4 protein [Minisyncoccia bacterium]